MNALTRFRRLRAAFAVGCVINIVLWFVPAYTVNYKTFSQMDIVAAVVLNGVDYPLAYFLGFMFVMNALGLVLAFACPSRMVFVLPASVTAGLMVVGALLGHGDVTKVSAVVQVFGGFGSLLLLVGFAVTPPEQRSGRSDNRLGRMKESEALVALLQEASQSSGASTRLGFDVGMIRHTLAQLPAGSITGLESLFASAWPSESVQIGRLQLFGPEQIEEEHAKSLPGSVVVKYGFLCIGSDDGGARACYCLSNQKVYLLPSEYVSESAVFTESWQERPPSVENIRATAVHEWDSLSELFQWALDELDASETDEPEDGESSV